MYSSLGLETEGNSFHLQRGFEHTGPFPNFKNAHVIYTGLLHPRLNNHLHVYIFTKIVRGWKKFWFFLSYKPL